MIVKSDRLKRKIERTEEKLKSMEGVIRVLSPPVYVFETEDVMRAERQYERLTRRLDSYRNKFLTLQNAS
jgi:predicted RND superfamily exporter protein